MANSRSKKKAKAAAKKPPAKRPAAKKPAGKRPAAKRPAAKKPARKPTPKVSPKRGLSVADWAKQELTADQAEMLDILSELVAREVLDATSSIQWAQPVWELDGPLAFFMPASKHVTFGFWRGAELDDPSGLLEGGARMKHVKLRAVHEAHRPELADFVRQAAELNREKGSPAKRAR